MWATTNASIIGTAMDRKLEQLRQSSEPTEPEEEEKDQLISERCADRPTPSVGFEA